jgi:carbon-monoxide dehydrogenase medium subunit
MIPTEFDYHRPASVDEALELLSRYGEDAKLFAGGHSLLPAMKLRLSSPAVVIDISRLEDLKGIGEEDGHIVIGGGATHYEIESSDLLKEKTPLIAQAAAVIGDVQVRNMGTLGGSIAHADPAADYPAAVLASDAEIRVVSPGAERTIAAADFFLDIFSTGLEVDELILDLRIPLQKANTGASYLKFPHPASRFAVVGCAASVTVEGGNCSDARVAFTGIANAAFRDSGVEGALKGSSLDEAAIAAAAEKAADGVELNSDAFAGEDYRLHLAKVYAKRAITAAVAAV